MCPISTEEGLDALDGLVESATLEIKGVHEDGCLKKTEKLVEAIQGFLNGAESLGHIIIGLHENKNQEVDIQKKCPVTFPAKIKDMDFEPESFAAYRDHLMKMLRSGTEISRRGSVK